MQSRIQQFASRRSDIVAQAQQGTAHIMGASSGIDAIYEDRLPRRGYNLGPVARRRDRLIAFANHIVNSTHQRVEIAVADLNELTSPACVESDTETASASSVGREPPFTVIGCALAAKSYFPRQAGHRPAKGVLDLSRSIKSRLCTRID
jgi:hypothetical protein